MLKHTSLFFKKWASHTFMFKGYVWGLAVRWCSKGTNSTIRWNKDGVNWKTAHIFHIHWTFFRDPFHSKWSCMDGIQNNKFPFKWLLLACLQQHEQKQLELKRMSQNLFFLFLLSEPDVCRKKQIKKTRPN